MRELKRSVTFHMAVIGVFMLLLIIPLSMIEDLIVEREQTGRKTIEEIRRDWAYTQEIAGPVLTVPYNFKRENGESVTRWLHFTPEELGINGNIIPSVLYRSIYEISVYNTVLDIKGSFVFPDVSAHGVAEEDVQWDRAFVSVQISDLKGIEEKVELSWNDEKVAMRPGVGTAKPLSGGLHVPVKVAVFVDKEIKNDREIKKVRELEKSDRYAFSMQLKLKGSSGLFFSPLGKLTAVSLNSPWKSPKFEGSFLPAMRTVSDKGFTADWKVLNYNREFPETWEEDGAPNLEEALFGVTLFLEVNDYSKSDRTAKYGFLFILFTFAAFFFSEVFSRIRIHPVQYTLVGIALCLFYLLLTSLSEHIGFNVAYLVAAIGVTLLITLFTGAIYRNWRFGAFIGAALVVLYGFIFVILHSYNYALLAGSIGLFVVLSILMYVSRQIDWYALMHRDEGEEKKKEEIKAQV